MSSARWACAGVLAAAFAGVQAQTLSAALEGAARYDPVFQAARAELDASRQLLPIARAARLPSVSATFSDAKVDGSREVPGPLGAVRSDLDYRSPNYALSVRVPLLNPEAWHRERGAQARVEQAEQVFRARRLELLDRTATAWLNLRRAEQLAALAAEPVRAAAALAELARNQFAAGEATRVDVADAQAALAQATALEAAAHSAVALARLAL
jgi:outer membrane protein TolC